MNLEGEIWELELIPRLIELGSQSFTGALRFENDAVIKIVYFKEGSILSASTNDRADSIDEILLRSGKVTREHVKQALSKRKETETLGDALLGLGFIAKRELAWARRVQLIGILRSISEWQAGSFTIVADYLPKREEGTAFPLPQIVLELILTDQDRSKYDRALESGSAVFRKSTSFDASFAGLGLNQEAETIASRIDGTRTAAEVASEAGSDAFNVYKLLNALYLLGLVEKAEVSHEVSAGAPTAQSIDFGSPSEPTMEMPLDYGGEPGSTAADDEFGASSAVTSDYEMPRLDTDSSVPPEDLDSYAYTPPVAEDSEDLGIGLGSVEPPHVSPPTPAPPLPSEDLGSIEALRNFEVSHAEFPPIEERIAKKQQKKSPIVAPQARRTRRTGLIAAATVGVLALGAAGGWYYLESKKSEEPVPVAQAPRPRPVPQPVGDTAIAGTDTAMKAPPSASDTAATATSELAPTATSAPPAKPPVVTTTTRVPEATPKPVPPPAKPPASSSKYAGQAQQYAKDARTVPFTVQFALVCRDASIEGTVRTGGSKVWYVPITYRGESCYRVFWGRYVTQEQAERGAAEIPASLRGGKPSVVSPGSLGQ